MIVRLDFEDGRQAVAYVDRARVFARTLYDAAAGRRQLPEMDPRALIAAVLGPHDGKNAKLGEGGLAPKHFDDALILVACESMLLEQFGVWSSGPAFHRAAATAPCVTYFTTDSSTASPSALPSCSSHARSGCGISPTTLRRSLHNPARLFAEPFGLASSVTSPVALVYRKMTCLFRSSRSIVSGSA